MRPVALLALVAGVLSVVAAPAAAVPVHHAGNGKDIASFSIGSKITGVFDKVACESCKAAVTTFKKAVLNNPTEAVIRAAALTICVTLKLATTNVCKQIVPEFAPWIFDIASKYKSEDICIDFLNAPCANKVPEWKVVFPKEKPANKPPSRRTGVKKYLLHLSDWHFDPEYTPGLEAECGEPTCCRPPNKSGPGIKRAAGKWGDYKCDTPIALGRSMLNHASSLFGDNVDYMLLTGDFPGHNVWQITPAYALQAAQTTADIFREYLDPFNITVFPAMGNHESSPVNSFPPANVRSDPSFWLYEGLANQWKPWLPERSLEQVRKTGSFSVSPREGLRVISINTNMCLGENWYLLINRRIVDQDGILDWMITELQAAEDNNERVIIIGHIPPGNGDCDVRWSQAYHQITERYQDIISAGFFGHRHKDSFQIHYNYRDDLARLENDAFVVDYVGPAVSPDVDANPSYRVYEVDAGSYEVLNTYTFIADISQQDKWGNDAEWFLEYDAKSAYGDGSETDKTVLDAAWWHRVTERMARPGDRSMFDDFLRYIVRLRPAPSCDESCRASTICGMRSGRGGTACPANANLGWMDVTSGTDIAAISVC